MLNLFQHLLILIFVKKKEKLQVKLKKVFCFSIFLRGCNQFKFFLFISSANLEKFFFKILNKLFFIWLAVKYHRNIDKKTNIQIIFDVNYIKTVNHTMIYSFFFYFCI